ncbi:99710f0b-243e-429c-baa5-32c1fc2d01cf [Thermothielavioides terrestris]|uniref:99710f0b-243e-429c-baa5-32c1fc2d01cf n=1 Tax=Thermothielavioides terrestris TaxID=2587410 RepID=A0A446BUG8_9PEZI|nr:99710f0b-243e-429c-baa5-32c1fc2d01cf [Thermothielavioides terrestris]
MLLTNSLTDEGQRVAPPMSVEGVDAQSAPTGRQQASPLSGLAQSLKHPMNKMAYLNQLAKAARKAQQQMGSMSTAVLAQLPATAFSELLRSLDPVDSISKELDPTDGMHVGPGMAQFTPMGQEFDAWGVKKCYVSLLAQVMNASKLRIEAGRHLLLSDYKILLRCAGAAADLDAVKAVWDMMAETGLRERDPEAYHELVKSRFQTEPLYSHYDLARYIVRPMNLHMQKLWVLGWRERLYLQMLGYNRLKRQRHHFGHNRQSLIHVEHLARIMRQRWPPLRMMWVATKLCYIVDEGVLCAIMVALARSGAINVFQTRILQKYWGVEVTRRPGSPATVKVQTIAYAADSPLRPSAKLLEAIVNSYCVNAEFSTALQVLHAVSSCYGIPIPDKVWFDLLEWAYVLSSKPVATEWKAVRRQFRGKGVSRNAVQLVWNTMTSEPFNVRPGLYQYQLLAHDLVSRGNVPRALDVLLEMEPMYRQLLAQLESTFCKHALSTALGVEVAESEMAWRRARARKHAALYRLQILCRRLLKKVGKGKAGPHMTVRGVPQFIEAFRDLMPASITYQIQTGTVQIHHVPPVRRLEWTTAEYTKLPATTGEVRISGLIKRLPRPKKVKEKRLGPAPHASLYGFLTQSPSWPLIQREFS